jgi:hypothetical protein
MLPQPKYSLTPPTPQYIPNIPDDVPVYRLTGPCWMEIERINEGQYIVWPDEPNKFMEPVNSLAIDKYRQFLKKCDDGAKKVSEKQNTPYQSALDAFEEALTAPVEDDGRKTRLLGRPQNQGRDIFAKKRGRPKVEKLSIEGGNG